MPGDHAYCTVAADELTKVWPRAALVDVRSREEHATAHVPGSLNIPLDDFNVAGGITEWYRNGHPVTYQPTPEHPPQQQPGHARAGLRSLPRKLFHSKTA